MKVISALIKELPCIKDIIGTFDYTYNGGKQKATANISVHYNPKYPDVIYVSGMIATDYRHRVDMMCAEATKILTEKLINKYSGLKLDKPYIGTDIFELPIVKEDAGLAWNRKDIK